MKKGTAAEAEAEDGENVEVEGSVFAAAAAVMQEEKELEDFFTDCCKQFGFDVLHHDIFSSSALEEIEDFLHENIDPLEFASGCIRSDIEKEETEDLQKLELHERQQEEQQQQMIIVDAGPENTQLESQQHDQQIIMIEKEQQEEEVKERKVLEFAWNNLPPGVKFDPTDEEMIDYFLRKKINGEPLLTDLIHEVELYYSNPNELTAKYNTAGMGNWFFFTSRNRKYPQGKRPDRSAREGFWKATGCDASIKDSSDKEIGKKKALSFHYGKQGRGIKTSWKMYEYMIVENQIPVDSKNRTMKLDDWVLCKMYSREHGSKEESDSTTNPNKKQKIRKGKKSSSCSLATDETAHGAS